MELSDLVTFSAVARCGGITAAAAELNTVQSNVTTRIKILEEELNVSLFDRHSRGVALTAAGRRLLPYAARLISLSQEAVAATKDDGSPKGPLVIGSMETTAATRLPPLLAAFHSEHPAVQFTLRTGPTSSMVEAVLDGALEGAFVCGPVDHPELTVISAFHEELMLVTSSRWTSLAALRKGTTGVGPTALVFRTGCSYRQRLDHVMADLGWPGSSRLEFGTLDGIIGCVAADVGITILPRNVIEGRGTMSDIRLHALKSSHAHVETLFVRRRKAHESAAMREFISQIERVVE